MNRGIKNYIWNMAQKFWYCFSKIKKTFFSHQQHVVTYKNIFVSSKNLS